MTRSKGNVKDEKLAKRSSRVLLFPNFTRHQLITHTISICWWVDRALYRLNLFLVGIVLEQVEPVLVGTVPNRSAQGAGPRSETIRHFQNKRHCIRYVL